MYKLLKGPFIGQQNVSFDPSPQDSRSLSLITKAIAAQTFIIYR